VSVAGFIATQRAQFGIPHAIGCRALGVSQAWFYKWRYGDASPRRARREQLAVAIRRLFAAHRGFHAPTQWITRAMVTLRVRVGVVPPGAGGVWGCGGGW
jgi:hypothetical protein